LKRQQSSNHQQTYSFRIHTSEAANARSPAFEIETSSTVSSILSTSIVSGPLVTTLFALAAVVVTLALVVRPSPDWSRRRWTGVAIGSSVAGALVGLVVVWIVVDLLDSFGVALSLPSRAWIAAAFAGMALLVVGLRRARTWRRIASVPALVLIVAVAAMGVNIDFHQYVSVRALFGLSQFAGEPLPELAADPSAGRPALADWTAPAGMPTVGQVSSVTIPNTKSGFVARPAVVYLPPAALTADPPALPVVILLSGQPGSPDDPMVSGTMHEYLDAWATAHHGLAPIVVSPDQLGDPAHNPMCVDSTPYGKSDTFLTQDVPAWITKTLPASTDRADWAIAGFSQGGTCAIQLGAKHPTLFGTIIDVSGELVPSLGDPATTIRTGFQGDEAAYNAALPQSLLAAGAPYSDTFATFAVGEDDATFKPWAQSMEASAKAAGMTTDYLESPGTAHDWHTGHYGLSHAFDELFPRWGLGSS
jgi:enterochelin esterase-like enzyme